MLLSTGGSVTGGVSRNYVFPDGIGEKRVFTGWLRNEGHWRPAAFTHVVNLGW
jgi:hypothetical protein